MVLQVALKNTMVNIEKQHVQNIIVLWYFLLVSFCTRGGISDLPKQILMHDKLTECLINSLNASGNCL